MTPEVLARHERQAKCFQELQATKPKIAQEILDHLMFSGPMSPEAEAEALKLSLVL